MQDHASRAKGLAWAALAVGLGLAFAFGLAPLARAIPWSWEQHLASMLTLERPDACTGNLHTQVLLQRLVQRLYPVLADDERFSIDVSIVRDPVVNAYAELGGHIMLNSGLLAEAQSAEEVAGVLAHEIEHVARRHILQGFMMHAATNGGVQAIFGNVPAAGWTKFFLNMDFSRTQEAQADAGGLARLRQTHISSAGLQAFFARMENSSVLPAFLSDHPASQARSELAAQAGTYPTEPIMTAEEWKALQHFCP